MPKGAKVIMKKVVAQPSVPGFRPGHGPKITETASSAMESAIDPGSAMAKTISRYTSGDWLKKLETVIGNLSTIEDERYRDAIDKISKCESNIRICFKRITKNATVTPEFTEAQERFLALSAATDILHKAYTQKRNKKGKLHDVIVAAYVPDQLVKSDWFNSIKLIEREIYRYIEHAFISPDGETKIGKTARERRELKVKYDYATYQELLKKYPNINELYNIYGMNPSEEIVYNSFMDIQKYANAIINILLTPMYDVTDKVTKSYDRDLAHAFKSTIQKGFATRDLIIELLTNFAYAQYKSNLTGSTKYFLQMLSDELTEGSLSQMNSARFLDVMDSINTDAMAKESKAAGFTVKAREIMKKMIDMDGKMDASVLTEIKDLIGDEDEADAPELKEVKKTLLELPDEVEKALSKYDDLLGDAPGDEE